MHKRKLFPILSALILLAAILALTPTGTFAQTTRTFPETGKTVRGIFLEYWLSHGGLAQQGYPISDELEEISPTDGKIYITQYFERAVFEYHPEFAGTPNAVLLSLLGVFFYDSRYNGEAPNQSPSSTNARKFAETGKSLGGVFRAYWEIHGGLAQQGYPISDEFQEVNSTDGKTYTVQYFERAVFEYHPENKGKASEVLLSLLGVFRHNTNNTGNGNAPPPVTSATDFAVPGWTHVVATGNNVVLFYNGTNGHAVTAKLGDDGTLKTLVKYPSPLIDPYGLWTHVVPCPNNVILMYNSGSGAAAILSMGSDGLSEYSEQQFSPGWQNIACDDAGGMIFYALINNQSGIRVGKMTPQGGYSEVRIYGEVDTPEAHRWTHFIPLTGRKWFWYLPGQALGEIKLVEENGGFYTLTSYDTFSTGWTHIAANPRSQMMFYDKTAGVFVTAIVTPEDTFHSLQTYYDVGKHWSNLAAARNNIFLFYSTTTGEISGYSMTGDGLLATVTSYGAPETEQ